MLGLANMQPRQLAAQVLNFALVLSTAFMMWKGLSVVSDSPSPIVVVLSGSMEPAFQRGDLLFLWNRGADTQVGEIVVRQGQRYTHRASRREKIRRRVSCVFLSLRWLCLLGRAEEAWLSLHMLRLT